MVLLSFSVTRGFTQCQESASVIINEIGIRSGSKSKIPHSQFIELFVVGNPKSPTTPVNLSGWIVDDNNSPTADDATNPGHIILGSSFSSVKPGATILLYQGDNTLFNIDKSLDGAPNSEGNFQIQIDNGTEFLNFCKNNPDYTSAAYPPQCVDEYDPVKAAKAIELTYNGDVIQLRNNKKSLVHALKWGKIGFPESEDIKCVKISSGSLPGIFNTYFNYATSNWLSYKNYEITTSTTAGQLNNEANKVFYENLLAEKLQLAGAVSECYVCHDGCITLDPGSVPKGYQFSWESSGDDIGKPKAPEIKICPKENGQYIFTIKDEKGLVIAQKIFNILINNNGK